MCIFDAKSNNSLYGEKSMSVSLCVLKGSSWLCVFQDIAQYSDVCLRGSSGSCSALKLSNACSDGKWFRFVFVDFLLLRSRNSGNS